MFKKNSSSLFVFANMKTKSVFTAMSVYLYKKHMKSIAVCWHFMLYDILDGYNKFVKASIFLG